jgi:hypothetical protein
MAVYTSDGQEFEDEFQYERARAFSSVETPSIDSTMPLGSPEKPTGAFNLAEGTPLPDVSESSSTGSVEARQQMAGELNLDDLDDILNKTPPKYSLPRESTFGGQPIIEDTMSDDIGLNFEHLYEKLNSLKDKLPVGGKVILYNERGNQFWYERRDDYIKGFREMMRPGKAMS